jgi:hypothetical protein
MNPPANPRHDPFWLALLTIGLCALILGLTGCGAMLPQKRTDSAAVKTAENVATTSAEKFKRVVEGEKAPAPIPPPQVTVTGSSNTVQIAAEAPGELISVGKIRDWARNPYREETTYESAGEVAAGSTESASASRTISLPLGVSLILLAIGIIMLCGALWLVKRSSATAAAAFSLGDDFFAQLVRSLRTEVSNSTDSREIARLNGLLAEINDLRGKLAASRARKGTP